MKLLLNTVTALVIIICASSCQPDGVEKDMVRFDRSFIPVLYFVYLGDLEKTEIALNVLEKEWRKFAVKYKDFDHSPDWKEQYMRMEGWLSDCKLAIETKDRFFLYNQLFNIRYELMAFREEEEMDYYLDYLWDFEASLNLTTEVALDPMLCRLEWEEFEFLVEELGMYWEILLNQPFDSVLFEMGPAEEKLLKMRQDEMTDALSAFSKDVRVGEDGYEFQASAARLIPVYLKLLASYGSFEISGIDFAFGSKDLLE